MTRGERARENFFRGENCTQAVLLAFSDALCADETFLRNAARPFGGGMGRLRLTCGAVSGAVMAIGLFFPERSKSELYGLVQKFARAFAEKNGSVVCGELLAGAGIAADTSAKAEERTPEYYRKRPCPELIRDAADILETILKEEGKL